MCRRTGRRHRRILQCPQPHRHKVGRGFAPTPFLDVTSPTDIETGIQVCQGDPQWDLPEVQVARSRETLAQHLSHPDIKSGAALLHVRAFDEWGSPAVAQCLKGYAEDFETARILVSTRGPNPATILFRACPDLGGRMSLIKIAAPRAQ